jgi:hypothetical protein
MISVLPGSRGDVGPPCQLTAILPGKIEQGCEHLRGEFDRDPIDPIEGGVAGQCIQALRGTLTDDVGKLVEMGRVNIGATVLRWAPCLG